MANHPQTLPPDPVSIGPHAATRPMATAASGVSWAAIFAGAAGAAAVSFVLVLLGTGLGMSSVSPWSNVGITATTFGWATIAWVTFISLAASGIGGYLAGRLRTRWMGLHTAEVYFRDTAHGFLAWAVATLLTAVMVSSVIGSAVGVGAKAGASVVGGAVNTAMAAGAAGVVSAASSQSATDGGNGPMGYFIDSLFRSSPAATNAAVGSPNGSNGSPAAPEIYRIFANSVQKGELPQEDAQYVAQRIAQQTGITQEEAQKRVTDTFAKAKASVEQASEQAKEAADAARKATAYGSLWLVFSLLVGALVASVCATTGGRRRDLQSTL